MTQKDPFLNDLMWLATSLSPSRALAKGDP